ncbi:DUF1963 domain-containing protein [Comamonas aquatilis]|uniref:hypothetical protein n=1 Tax=Comamonas aquatilis TaxID=1778406 RepID=UPI0039EF4FFE
MQFLGQIRSASDELLLLFMCQNDPGLCEEWDADGGGNQVIAVGTSELQLLQPPADGETLRQTRHGASLLTVDAADYDQARSQWMESSAKPGREVLGQLGGEPSWLQNDETPQCDSCRQPMEFVAQLEQGPDWKTEMNFGGGGCAYIFRCSCAGGSAKLLWQC